MQFLLFAVVPFSALWLLLPSPSPQVVTQDPVQQAQMLKQAQQLARLVDPHQRLSKLLGEWNITLRTTPPGGTEQNDRGVVVGKAILGGRYVVLNFNLKLQGNDLEAVQILGFDTLRQHYTASWRDDLSTWSVECSGAPQAQAPDALQLHGTLADARDPTGRPFRLELDLGEKDHVTLRLFDTHEGSEFLLQTQDWARR